MRRLALAVGLLAAGRTGLAGYAPPALFSRSSCAIRRLTRAICRWVLMRLQLNGRGRASWRYRSSSSRRAASSSVFAG